MHNLTVVPVAYVGVVCVRSLTAPAITSMGIGHDRVVADRAHVHCGLE